MSDFMSHFNTIPDPRIDRCKRHALMDILFLSISAVLCGAEGWEEMKTLGMRGLIGLKNTFLLKMVFPNTTPLLAY